MRYYSFILNTNAEKLARNSTVNLKDYDYDSPIGGMNYFMYAKLKNGVSYMAYREDEKGAIYSAFAYNERKYSFQEAYEYISGILNEVFRINKIKEEPFEITTYKFIDCLLEARRRRYYNSYHRIVEEAHLNLFDIYNNQPEKFPFRLKEKIISVNDSNDTNAKKDLRMYDKSFINEISNIEQHINLSKYDANIVHYVISGRSVEAASDMTELLIQSLARANRISGRRMEIITDIEPDLYKINNHMEDIIKNNYGGVIVFDLSEKFGYNPVDYCMVSKYIENLVKKYKKECLFVFTYNIDKPGFSYLLLPNLKKYIIPVMLREGSGDRDAATCYMKALIRNSEYSKYAKQAKEFMGLYPEEKFSQTDVLMAYEQFETWCINKNILQAYNYECGEDFLLDRDENIESHYDKFNQLIGLELVKEQVNNIIAADIVERERRKRKGVSYKSGTMHMIFGGNPGTAKTTVAKLFAGIAKEKGILKSGAFVECGGMDLDGLGCIMSIREAFIAAQGGVLFIDEAYSLKSDTAVTVLIQEMENHRDDVIVILAGYNERMKAFIEINEGLKSRIPYWIDFPDYNTDELTDIFMLMVHERCFNITDDAIREARHIFEKVRMTDNFGNGRYVRNLVEHAIQKQSVRLLAIREVVDNIEEAELFSITKDDICVMDEGLKEERVVGTAKNEFDKMIGLSSVKSVIRKAIAGFKLNKICMDKGIGKSKASLHMVFTGNPGTAKTTVARLFAEIMKDEKVLPTGNFVEVGRADLVGTHVGTTAPLVKKRFKEAKGGVLFIDEAYSLCDDYQNGYGDEAINTIIQEMENHRDDVIVIFAGYPEPMQHFLERNPGMLSRIAFHVEFDDYSVDELCEITKLMLSKKQMTITDGAMEKLRNCYEVAKETSDYGNGRYVRKILEEAELNLAERISTLNESEITEQLITTIEECDIPKSGKMKISEKQSIGFCVQ